MSLPKFSFAKSDISTTADLEKEIEATTKQNKHFRPGRFTNEVISAKFDKMDKSDPTWASYEIIYRGAGGQELKDWLLVPTAQFKKTNSNGKTNLNAYKRLASFLAAIGVTLTPENAEETLTSVFGSVERTLVGKKLTMELNYRGNHVAYLGKDSQGNNQYGIKLRDGTSVQENGVDVVVGDFDSAAEVAEQKGLELENFVKIVQFVAAAPLKAVSNW